MVNRRAIHLYGVAVALAMLLLVLLVLCNRLFSITVHQEGYRPFSAIMMFQGAPASHYEQEHAFSFALFRFTSSPFGAILGATLVVGAFLGWANVMQRVRRRAVAALIT